ncbi:hypothetical protein [Novosphingobium sp.]|uniref:hypothetical protein n=1 Tax=Novosphingobium sp. TaxID=1874826 RepID=UPI00334206C8
MANNNEMPALSAAFGKRWISLGLVSAGLAAKADARTAIPGAFPRGSRWSRVARLAIRMPASVCLPDQEFYANAQAHNDVW